MSTLMKGTAACPSCGKPIPAGALAGLCPACLLAQGAETEHVESGAAGRFQPPPVDVVAGLFPQLEILGLLGAGGMGAVYKARQPSLDRIVALKILPAASAPGAAFAERFNREARALARLSHPNIVAVHEFGQAGALSFFIMEFVDGANLRQLEQAGRLSPRESLQIIPQICDALQYAHDEGVVHRDIKPENVLVDRKGRVKIADFGLAKILTQDVASLRLTAEGQVMGTPHYMAPEQVERPLAVDHRADIYSLGVVFYEMLTGDLPLGKFPPPSRKVEVDVRLDEVVLRALENDPARRYQKASDVKARVETIAGTAPPAGAAHAPGLEPQFLRWAGFRLIKLTNGLHKINWPQVLFAWVVLFGVLSVAFGVVTLVRGGSGLGWLGVAGWPSVVVRLALAAAIVAFGTWRALRRIPKEHHTPRTPEGTVILQPERFSRKAILGVCWLPLVCLLLLVFIPAPVTPAKVVPGPTWRETLLAIVTLPLGFSAPLGTTLLGWWAVADIRRARGRLRGLPLALFDGLFFPLLALDVFLFFGAVNAINWWTASVASESFRNPPPALVSFAAGTICLLADFFIVRRVWRAVRPAPGAAPVSRDWWWSRTPGAIAIAVACVLMLTAVAHRQQIQPGVFKTSPAQVATADAASGALVAKLPNGGTMELLALADADAAPNEWWRPDGTLLDSKTFAIKTTGRVKVPNAVSKDLLFRFLDLPEGKVFPTIECNPGSSYSTGDTVWRDGLVLANVWPVRMAWSNSVRTVTIRLGVGAAPWRTVSTLEPKNHRTSSTHQAGDPNWTINFHHASEQDGQTLLTVVRGLDDGLWNTRILAVDTNDVEYNEANGTGTPGEKTATWTYTFRVPLARVREFRAQIRPVHWVEFRDVALQGKGLARRSNLPQRIEVGVATRNQQTGAWFGKVGGTTVELLAVSDGNSAPNAWWTPDGTAIPDTLYESLRFGDPFHSGRTNKDFILRWKNLPEDATGPFVEFDEGGGGTGGGEVFRNGKQLETAWPLTSAFLPSATQTTMRVGFAVGLWQTISTHLRDQSSSTYTFLPEVPRFDAKVHQIGENEGAVEVTMVIAKQSRDWELRVIAVDTNGTAHTRANASGTPAEPAMIWTYSFLDLPLAKVKQFEVQVRPVHWIEFRDVMLQPRDRSALGQSTRTFVPTRFSPEREVQLTELFDFDHDQTGEFPAQNDGSKVVDGIKRNPSWMIRHGYDVDAGTNELRVLQVRVLDLKNDEWDSISPAELQRRLGANHYQPPRLPSAPAAVLPVTHGFRTMSDGIGVLQITALDRNKPAVTLRYKLIERAHFE